jgi:(2S)-methylsuccinyl-CoA dehydrogenase
MPPHEPRVGAGVHESHFTTVIAVRDSQKDLTAAATVIDGVASLLRRATKRLAESGGPEIQQVLAYDIAHASAALETSRSLIDYGAKGNAEATFGWAFV